ncbi:hypothetical protein COW81_01110 [Candidatus Campbellbacteria bacterium CG22_combo_CG10-13_8_21_14_all_36_13]|uniref:Transcriptional regulator n=1 Tax=Candidatus Campbellbacteria bacterium CG22_combo_CG10-13_8_21_14_all_36_13 TaxID=1974529 RepID=A0A2H0E0E7_9BACT|nr:MAG: hypothetical protein COW81_01110 [Candidatus Campbellbacteria bacterium CG22_combo_CG10-13_8_21_14_all_36_13]
MKSEIKKNVENRLRRIEGQVRGIQKMVNKDTYCIDVITQLSAIRKALSAVEDLMLENHLSMHVVEQIKGGNHKRAVDEIMSVYKVSKKK